MLSFQTQFRAQLFFIQYVLTISLLQKPIFFFVLSAPQKAIIFYRGILFQRRFWLTTTPSDSPCHPRPTAEVASPITQLLALTCLSKLLHVIHMSLSVQCVTFTHQQQLPVLPSPVHFQLFQVETLLSGHCRSCCPLLHYSSPLFLRLFFCVFLFGFLQSDTWNT